MLNLLISGHCLF